MSAHFALRDATRAAHDRVDAQFSTLNLVDPADYGDFLTRQAMAFLPAEALLSEAGAGNLIAGWDDLKRGHLLTADLLALAIDPPAPAKPPLYPTAAHVLGGAYVLEGSRLGGAMLRRSVGSGLPRSFLDSVQPKGRWRAFTDLLDGLLDNEESLALATESALQTFALFERKEWDAPSE